MLPKVGSTDYYFQLRKQADFPSTIITNEETP
jgi:hypothetical protein